MSVREKVKEADKRIGSPLDRGREMDVVRRAKDAAAMTVFHKDRLRRRLKHRDRYRAGDADQPLLADLRRDGYAVMRGVFDPAVLAGIYRDFESCLDVGTPFDPAPHDAVRASGERGNTNAYVSPEEMSKGQAHYRNLTNRVTLTDPMITLPSVIPLVFNEEMDRLAGGYMKTIPAVGSVTLRKSFANGLPSFDTLLFHIDRNSPKLLRFFIYLHDVGEGGGPFCYVRGSHRKRFPGAHRQKRWQDEEITGVYGESEIVHLTAPAGDVVVADTAGFHRGTKPVAADRSMLTVTYVVQPEFGGKYPRNKITSADYSRLDGRARAAADLLSVQ